ncbi:hypothetical protein EDC94DRAFT_583868 [Helicostylum pulchrum]|nr:hypothetical protein EDC94DRAFT_583868 [Helicostylum pulchrum]
MIEDAQKITKDLLDLVRCQYGFNISKLLLKYRERCKEKVRDNKVLSDIKQFLNDTFLISKDNSRYEINLGVYTQMISELTDKYDACLLLDEIDEFQVEYLRNTYKSCSNNREGAFNSINLLSINRKGHKESILNSLRNLIKSAGYNTEKDNEDMFTKRFVTPFLTPFMKEFKYFRMFSCDEESSGSRSRKKKKNGRRSNGGLEVVYKDNSHQIFHYEVRSPKIMTEDNIYHPDFLKLCNLMKDEIDHLLKKNCSQEIPIFGDLVGGHKITVYAMDLVYTNIYRLHIVGIA